MICRYEVDSNGTFIYQCRQEGLLFYAHRSFDTGKQAANIVLAVEIFLLLIFWICTIFMRKDFSKLFIAITMIPLTIRAAVLLFHTAVIHAVEFPNMKIVRGLRLTERILETLGCFSLMIGSTIFSAMVIHTARAKKVPELWRTTSLPYLLVITLICFLTILDVFPPTIATFAYSNLSPLLFLAILSGFAIVMIGLFVLICVVGVCCLDDKYSTNCDPVLIHAQSRMFWTIPLMIIAGFASLIDFIGNLSTDPYLQTISMSISPPLLLLSVFLLLPAYRTAVFCCFANNRLRNKVGTLTIAVRPCSQSGDPSLKM